MLNLLEQIASPDMLDAAYTWCCKARAEHPASSDIWWVMERWAYLKPRIQEQILSSTYRFSPQRRYKCSKGEDESRAVWDSVDAIVLKAITIVMTEYLHPRLSKSCTHLLGNGGVPGAVRYTRKYVNRYRFYYKTDIASYYSSINHDKLCALLSSIIPDKSVCSLIFQTIRRCESYNGHIYSIKQGIPLGSSLSPLLSGVMLMPLDSYMKDNGIPYTRFMDDFVYFSNSRNHLKRIIRNMYSILNKLKLFIHKGKTKVGRVELGFDFLGFNFIRISKYSQQVSLSKVSYISFWIKFKAQSGINRSKSYFTHFKVWCKGCGVYKLRLSQLFQSARYIIT